MSDEEKKAIEILGEFKKNGFHLLNLKYESRVSTTKHIENSIEIILELIEKQSKEIEELKDNYSDEKIRNTIIKRYREVIEKDYVSKDKIKAKIEEVQNMKAKAKDIVFKSSLNYIETELKSLLEKE